MKYYKLYGAIINKRSKDETVKLCVMSKNNERQLIPDLSWSIAPSKSCTAICPVSGSMAMLKICDSTGILEL